MEAGVETSPLFSMTYHRESETLKFGSYTTHVTNHYRNGVLFAITERKRIHTCNEYTDDNLTMDGRKRKLEAFCHYVRTGHHDMACYTYHIT